MVVLGNIFFLYAQALSLAINSFMASTRSMRNGQRSSLDLWFILNVVPLSAFERAQFGHLKPLISSTHASVRWAPPHLPHRSMKLQGRRR